MKIKVLFIGGTGVISTSVSELAVKKNNIELFLLNRGNNDSAAPQEATLIRGDMNERGSIKRILDEYRFNVVVNWIAYTPDQIKADIDLFMGKVDQYIFISSASAYQKPLVHYMISESTPLKNPYWQYSSDKIACEDLLVKEYRENSFPATIVRPNYTYGNTMIPFVFNSRISRYTLVDRIKKGMKIIVPGDGTSLFTLTHSKDFAKGFVGLIGNTRSIGHAFHITSDEALTWDQVACSIGKTVGATPDICHIPSDLIATISPEHTGGLLGDKSNCAIFDNSKIKSFVPDYTATISFSEGVKDTISWYESHPEMCGIDEIFNVLCDRIIAQMQKAYI